MESSKSKENLSERALGIGFGGSGGLWDTERRPREPQGGLQELQSHDPSSLPRGYELPRSSAGHRPTFGGGAESSRLQWPAVLNGPLGSEEPTEPKLQFALRLSAKGVSVTVFSRLGPEGPANTFSTYTVFYCVVNGRSCSKVLAGLKIC